MKYIVLIAAVVVTIFPLKALAWETVTPLPPPVAWSPVEPQVAPAAVAPNGPVAVTSQSNPTVSSRSRSRATSRSGASASSTTQVTNSVNGGGSGAGNRAPDVLAPSLSGSNPCSVGGSLGGSGPSGGGILSWLTESDRCSLREDARLVANLGDVEAAKNVACLNPWIADGYAKAGRPCQRDINRWVQKEGYHQVVRADMIYWERSPQR